MDDEQDDRSFSAEGAVVEILERAGERYARIVLEPGTVLEVAAPSTDIRLGDRVIVDASLHVERVSGAADFEPAPLARGWAAGPPPAIGFRDYEHVLRVAGLFAAAIVLFLVWRSWMVPRDFGVYGHFRAGALTDIAKLTPRYAGQANCVDCHSDVQQVRAAGRHANVHCEACHGPLGRHARGETDEAPVRPSTRAVCLTCHTAREGKPKTFPQIVVQEHSDAGPCTECHPAHKPGLS